MLAVRIHALGGDPVVEELPDEQPAEGEAVVEVRAAAVGHLDLTVASGRFPRRPTLPYVPGTDGAGLVVRSAHLAPGTPVRVRGAGVGIVRDGTWRELAAVPEEALHPLAPDADLRLAAVFASPCAAAHVAVHEVGDLRSGERVAVTGAAGAVGSLAVQLALRAGAADVVGLVRRRGKAAAVPAGARVVVTDEEDAAAAVAGAHLLVDTVGGPGLPALLEAIAPGGRAALVGYTAGIELRLELPRLLAADVRLLPVNVMRWSDRLADTLEWMLAELQQGTLELAHRAFPLRDAPAAVAALREGAAAGRILLVP